MARALMASSTEVLAGLVASGRHCLQELKPIFYSLQ